MPTRIDDRFAALKKDGRAALVTFVMAGDPDLATSLEILKGLPAAGADVIEVGMPFTDPMADGPAIQAAGLRALKAGTTLKKTLKLVADFRAGDDATPIVLMGYYNPIYVYGVADFLHDAQDAGVDGLIVLVKAQPALQGRLMDFLEALPSGKCGPWAVSGWQQVVKDTDASARLTKLLGDWGKVTNNAGLKAAAELALKDLKGAR